MSLTQVNVWLDVVFFSLYTVVLVALAGHFVGNILTGRAYKRFVKWQWPEHEGPPVSALPKFLHFTHMLMIVVLVISGMYIRFPWFTGGRSAMRYVHYFAMTIVVLNLVWRVWYLFWSRRRDYREFAITRRDIVTAPKVILYYIFVKPSKPHLGKYNVMQKGTYIVFLPLLLVQALTGLALLTQTLPFVNSSPRALLLGFLSGGNIALAGAWVRMAHYTLNWLFIIIVTIHVYLSCTEDFAAFLDFFGLGFLDPRHREGEEGEADHEGEAGHGGDVREPLPEPRPEGSPVFTQMTE